MPYIEYKEPYLAIQAINVLTHNDIPIKVEEGRIYIDKKDEDKVRALFQKLKWDVKMLQDK